MPDKDLTDFERGYAYARQRRILLTERDPRHILELARIYLFSDKVAAELSRGIGLYCLETCVTRLIATVREFIDRQADD